MCETTTKTGKPCTNESRFFVTITTEPQPLGPNGIYGMETSPAGRSQTVCSAHLGKAVVHLSALPIVTYKARAAVAPIRQ